MEQDFYKGRLREQYGLDVRVPGPQDSRVVHEIIYHELCLGQVNDASRAEYLRVIEELAAAGAEAVILGCTEIGMLVRFPPGRPDIMSNISQLQPTLQTHAHM